MTVTLLLSSNMMHSGIFWASFWDLKVSWRLLWSRPVCIQASKTKILSWNHNYWCKKIYKLESYWFLESMEDLPLWANLWPTIIQPLWECSSSQSGGIMFSSLDAIVSHHDVAWMAGNHQVKVLLENKKSQAKGEKYCAPFQCAASKHSWNSKVCRIACTSSIANLFPYFTLQEYSTLVASMSQTRTTMTGQSLSRRMLDHCHRLWTCWGWWGQELLLQSSAKHVFRGGCNLTSDTLKSCWYYTWKFVSSALISLTYYSISSWYYTCRTMISYMIS